MAKNGKKALIMFAGCSTNPQVQSEGKVNRPTLASLSEILCSRHIMTNRSQYADETQTVDQGRLPRLS